MEPLEKRRKCPAKTNLFLVLVQFPVSDPAAEVPGPQFLRRRWRGTGPRSCPRQREGLGKEEDQIRLVDSDEVGLELSQFTGLRAQAKIVGDYLVKLKFKALLGLNFDWLGKPKLQHSHNKL